MDRREAVEEGNWQGMILGSRLLMYDSTDTFPISSTLNSVGSHWSVTEVQVNLFCTNIILSGVDRRVLWSGTSLSCSAETSIDSSSFSRFSSFQYQLGLVLSIILLYSFAIACVWRRLPV